MKDLSRDLINCIKKFMSLLKTTDIFNIYNNEGNIILEINANEVFFIGSDTPIDIESLNIYELTDMVEFITANTERILQEDEKINKEILRKNIERENLIIRFNKKIETYEK